MIAQIDLVKLIKPIIMIGKTYFKRQEYGGLTIEG